MIKMLRPLFICLAINLLVACDRGTGSSPPDSISSRQGTVVAELGVPFKMRLEQQGIVDSFRLTVADFRDIRCPSEVSCAEKGFAQFTLEIIEGDGPSQTYLMNSDPVYKPEMGLGVSVITHQDYRIEWFAVDPYPETPEKEIPLEDYQITFFITRED